jgi:hypothetical protein
VSSVGRRHSGEAGHLDTCRPAGLVDSRVLGGGWTGRVRGKDGKQQWIKLVIFAAPAAHNHECRPQGELRAPGSYQMYAQGGPGVA